MTFFSTHAGGKWPCGGSITIVLLSCFRLPFSKPDECTPVATHPSMVQDVSYALATLNVIALVVHMRYRRQFDRLLRSFGRLQLTDPNPVFPTPTRVKCSVHHWISTRIVRYSRDCLARRDLAERKLLVVLT